MATSVPLNTWRYVLGNGLRNFLHYEHSHSRIVFGSLRASLLQDESINSYKKPQLLEKLEELHKTDDLYSLSGKYYTKENQELRDKNALLCQTLSRDILDIAPKNVLRLVKFEEYLIRKKILDDNKSHWNKTYEMLYKLDKLRM
jgi:hypothetical protein